MIDLIKNQRLLSFIFFLFSFFLILIIAQWNLADIQSQTQVYSPLQSIFHHIFNDTLGLTSWVTFIIKLVLIAWQAALVNQIFRGQFLNQQHWLTFIIYCLSILIFHDLDKGLNSFFISLAFVYLVKILLEVPAKVKPYKEVFDVFDKEEVYDSFTKKEALDFLEDLNAEQFAKIQNFFETMPKLAYTLKVTNPKTKVESDLVLEGLASFFE